MDFVLSVDIHIEHDKVDEDVKSLLAVIRPTWCKENIDLKVCYFSKKQNYVSGIYL